MLVCSSRGFSNDEQTAVNSMQNEAVSATASVSLADIDAYTEVNISKIKGSYKSKCSENTRANTFLQISISGGPLEATDMSQWKVGLVAKKSTCIITDRGKTFIPVWDIIRMNHEELGGICEVLQNIWEKMSGLKQDQILLSCDSEAVLEKVNKWKEKNLTHKQIECYLAYLSEVKKEILDSAGNSGVWIREYLSDPILQNFLVSVVNSAPSKSQQIKSKMQALVKSEELKQLDRQTFPAIDLISKSLSYLPMKDSCLPKDIPDFKDFDVFLKETLEIAKAAQSNYNFADVTRAILLLRSHYEQTYDAVLITILVYPFQENGCCDNLDLKDLKSLRRLFSEHKNDFDQYVAKKTLYISKHTCLN